MLTENVVALFPDYISVMINALSKDTREAICEIRIRKNAPISISSYTKNLYLDMLGGVTADISRAVKSDERDVEYVINRLCEGSVYRYMSTIKKGYITTPDGVRAGVCGECVYEGDKISAVCKFNSVNIRIPHDLEYTGDILSRYILKNPLSSVLVISPPGYGKTTVIRSVAKALGVGRFGKALRVSVIDERGEILPSGAVGLIDRFSGYSKCDGIEIATRLFSPELIVCDEIGNSDDVSALLAVQNNGVPILATTHGSSVESALSRPNIRKLFENGAFDTFALIDKRDGKSSITIEKRTV